MPELGGVLQRWKETQKKKVKLLEDAQKILAKHVNDGDERYILIARLYEKLGELELEAGRREVLALKVAQLYDDAKNDATLLANLNDQKARDNFVIDCVMATPTGNTPEHLRYLCDFARTPTMETFKEIRSSFLIVLDQDVKSYRVKLEGLMFNLAALVKKLDQMEENAGREN